MGFKLPDLVAVFRGSLIIFRFYGLAKLFLHETMYAEQIAEAPTHLTQEEIAAILGTTREVVGRALRGLFNAGLLKKRGRLVYVVDRAGLELLAETNTIPERLRHL